MKRILMSILFSLAFFGMMKAQDEGRTWLKRYNIDPMNDNPVFTRPMHERDESRVQGAGICMNDGLAYNRRYYNFGSDWHYEPKLSLCKEEEAVFQKITGEFTVEDGSFRVQTADQILKYGVIPTDFGCIVAYRVWGWGVDGYQQINHYYATFDHKGNLIDAFYAGHGEWMNEILKAEPHGNYSPKENFGGGSMKFSEDNKTLTKTDYYYFKTADDKSDKWYDTTVFNISDKGIFSEASRIQKGKPEVNQLAEELYALETLPLSDKDVFKKWNTFVKKAKNNASLQPRIALDILRLYASRQQEFMAWTTANKKESVLITALKPGFEKLGERFGMGAPQMIVEKSLQMCTDNTVRNYWKNLKTFKSLFEIYD